MESERITTAIWTLQLSNSGWKTYYFPKLPQQKFARVVRWSWNYVKHWPNTKNSQFLRTIFYEHSSSNTAKRIEKRWTTYIIIIWQWYITVCNIIYDNNNISYNISYERKCANYRYNRIYIARNSYCYIAIRSLLIELRIRKYTLWISTEKWLCRRVNYYSQLLNSKRDQFKCL